MKAIIFGVTGQDGSHLVDLLLSKDYQVVGVSRRTSTDNTGRIKEALSNKLFTLFEADITDVHSVVKLFIEHADVDEVYNLAAQSHVAVSFKQPALTWDITGKGCLNILQSMVDLEVDARFYQASSSEMFGKECDTRMASLEPYNRMMCGGVFYDALSQEERDAITATYYGEPEKYQDENTKFMPQSPYAIAKCAAHHMTRLFREGYDIHASAGILFNHEGPRRGETFVTRKITKWIGEFSRWKGDNNIIFRGDEMYIPKIGNIKDSETFPKLRLGNLEAFRDWGFAGDYVEAMWMMLQQDSPEDYVICTGETHTIREFLDVAFKSAGITGGWEDYVVQDPEFYRPAEVDYLRGCNQKAKDVLGWTPKHSFEDLVAMMVAADLKD